MLKSMWGIAARAASGLHSFASVAASLARRSPINARLACGPYLWIAVGIGAMIFALVIYAVAALWGEHLFEVPDLRFHVRQAFSARQMLEHGQLLLQYSNDPPLGLQPSFLYYTPVWYTISGLFQIIFGISAYNSILLTYAFYVLIAAAGVVLLLQYLRVNLGIATFAAAMFSLSPYFLTNLFARAAIAEVSAMSILPMVFWAMLRCWDTGCRRHVGTCIVALGVFILSHKIFITWLFGFSVVLFVLLRPEMSLQERFKLAIVLGVYFAVAMLLTAPFWFTAMSNLGNLAVAWRVSISWSFLTSDLSLFNPWPYVHPASTTPKLHLQTAASVLLGLVMALVLKLPKGPPRAFFVATALSVLFATSLFDIVPFWKFMPLPLTVIQFPYRLLIFTILFGNVLIALLLQRQASAGRHLFVVCSMAACTLSLSVFLYLPSLSSVTSGDIERGDFLHHDYKEVGGVPVPTGRPVHVAREAARFSWNGAKISIHLDHSNFVVLPIMYSARIVISESGVELPKFRSDEAVAVYLPAGQYLLTIERRESQLALLMFAVGSFILFALVIYQRRTANTLSWPPPSRAHHFARVNTAHQQQARGRLLGARPTVEIFVTS
jgi:hypothetical protein